MKPTKLNRDLGQGRRGASHEKIVAAFFMGAEKSPRVRRKRSTTRPRSRQDEGREGGGGEREERKPAAYSLAFEIDENKLTPFSFLLLFIPWIDGFSSKNFKRVRVVIGFFPPPILFSFFLLTPLNSPL